MKKPIVAVVGVVALVIIGAAAFFGGGVLRGSGGSADSGAIISSSESGQPVSGQTEQTADPTFSRAAEVRGTVKSIEGDKLVIARVLDDPLANMTEEERAARREQMMKLSMEERQARRQQELQGLTTEDVSVTIPVGVPVVKAAVGQGLTDGGESASLADIRSGMSLVIWTQGGKTDAATAEYVRIAGTQP